MADEVTGVMDLEVLSYERLKARDPEEVQKMIRVFSNEGLAYLDLRGSSGKQFLEDLKSVIQHQRKFFEEDLETKMKYHANSNWKGFVTSDIGVEKIMFDREQYYQKTQEIPHAFAPVTDKVTKTSNFIDSALRDIAKTLCTSLDPPVPANLDEPENAGISTLHLGISKAKQGECLLGSHQDEDILTLTFYDEPFLQVLDRKTNEWKALKVKENMPIINPGLELQQNSKERLFAPWHRVFMGENEIDLVMYDLYEGRQISV